MYDAASHAYFSIQVGRVMIHSAYHCSKSLNSLVQITHFSMRTIDGFAERFEKIFGWELLLGILDVATSQNVNQGLAIA